jgi:hypothetical protein
VIKSREKINEPVNESSDEEEEERDTHTRRSSIKGGHEIYVQPHRRSSVPDIMVTTTVTPTPIKSILKKAPAPSKEKLHKEKDLSSFTQGCFQDGGLINRNSSFGKARNRGCRLAENSRSYRPKSNRK